MIARGVVVATVHWRVMGGSTRVMLIKVRAVRRPASHVSEL